MSARRTPAVLLWGLALVAALILGAAPASAFHFPWDQGHDTFDPDHGDDDTDPGDDEPCLFGSPFEPASGNFRWEERDLLIPGPGVSLNLTRHYNSHDLRSGPFGRGWSFTFDRRLVLTTNGSASFAICQSPAGRRVRFTRNTDGSFSPPKNTYDSLQSHGDGTFTLRLKNGLEYRFDAAGALVAVVDANGNTLTIEYDATGLLNRISDDAGRSLGFTKGPNGKVAEIVDPLGRVYRYSYDTSGNLVGYVDPAGHATTYLYTSGGKLREVRDANNHMVQRVTYEVEGRVASFVEEAETWTVSYFAGRTTETDSQGRVWTFWFNEDGGITRKRDPLGGEEQFEYDVNLNVVRYTDKRGNSTRFAYDARGNITTFTDPLGGVTTLTYEPLHNRLTSLTDPLGGTTLYEYDARGNLVRTTDPVGGTMESTHTSRGQRSSYTDGVGATTTYAYDAAGNLVEVTDPLGRASSFTYDEAGRVLSATDRSGAIATYEYDELDRPARITDAVGNVTTYRYDSVGKLVALMDALGHSTTYGYDAFDRLDQRVDPLGNAETFSYDVKGNLTRHVGRSGRVTDYVYDALSRLLRKTTVDNVITFAYDLQGNVSAVEDLDSATLYTYDQLNRVATVRSRALFGGQPDIIHTYTYDAATRLRAVSDSLGGRTEYAHDAAGRLITATTPSGKPINLSYDGRGRLQQILYPNGLATDYGVDTAGRLGRVETGFPAGPQLAAVEYAYGLNDQVSALTWQGSTLDFAYDPLRQVTAAGGGLETYVYDAVGNRLASHRSTAYLHDAANRLLEEDDFVYTYDADGNLASRTQKSDDAVTRYNFDGENRLVRIDQPDGTTMSYRYDGWGRRVAKEVGGVVTRYVYGFSDILLEFDGSGSLAARYTHGDRLDQPLSMERNGSEYYFHTDQLGSIRLVTDASGTVQNTYDYDAFGNFTEHVEAVASPYGFTAREFDPESGFYFYRARYYSPRLGRFISEDPVGFAGRDVNLYRYVWNDPLNHSDPSGLIPLDTLWDLGNVIYDIITGDCEALALDLLAMGVPYLPAGVTKIDDAVRLGDKALDVTRRPRSVRKKTVQDGWDNAASGSKPGSNKACPSCGKDVEVAPGQGPRDWDVDHQPPWSQRDLEGMTRQEVLDEYNRGTRLECPSCNRGRGAKPANDP
jgi:RHS repeat-associated protein